MSVDKNINISLIPKFVDKALENALDKPSKAIGDTLNDIWYLALGGHFGYNTEKKKIKYAYDLEKYKNEIDNEVDEIPKERRIEPDIQMVGQILENSKYCAEKEEIRRMFSKLIASSMDIDKSYFVRNSFASIIGNMSSDEAILLKKMHEVSTLKDNNRFELMDIRWIADEKIKYAKTGFNVIVVVCDNNTELRYVDLDNDSFETGATIYRNISLLGETAGCKYPGRISEYFQNLSRLGIVLIENKEIVSGEEYSKIIKSEFARGLLLNSDIEKKYHDYNRCKYFVFHRKYACFTDFGLSFINCCF